MAFIELSPFSQQVLTWLLLWSICLGVIHLALSWISGRLSLAAFCLLGALASTAVGLFVLWETLRQHAERSFTAALLWGPGFALGLFVVGAVGSAAWGRADPGPDPPARPATGRAGVMSERWRFLPISVNWTDTSKPDRAAGQPVPGSGAFPLRREGRRRTRT